jgi:hypothetical protein
LFLGGYVLDRYCDRKCLIELGEPVLPWSILCHVPLYVLPQIAEAFSFMIPCTLVGHIAKHPLKGVGTRTVRRQPEQRKTRMTGDPLCDGFRCMHTVVLHDHIAPRQLSSWVRGVQPGQEISN